MAPFCGHPVVNHVPLSVRSPSRYCCSCLVLLPRCSRWRSRSKQLLHSGPWLVKPRLNRGSSLRRSRFRCWWKFFSETPTSYNTLVSRPSKVVLCLPLVVGMTTALDCLHGNIFPPHPSAIELWSCWSIVKHSTEFPLIVCQILNGFLDIHFCDEDYYDNKWIYCIASAFVLLLDVN